MTATATLPEPALLRDPAPPGPRFPVGTRVKVDRYAGLLPAQDPDEGYTRIQPIDCMVLSVRLMAEVSDEWVQTGPDEDDGYLRDVVRYEDGWEYLVVRSANPADQWGWVGEDQLLAKGYQPTGA